MRLWEAPCSEALGINFDDTNFDRHVNGSTRIFIAHHHYRNTAAVATNRTCNAFSNVAVQSHIRYADRAGKETIVRGVLRAVSSITRAALAFRPPSKMRQPRPSGQRLVRHHNHWTTTAKERVKKQPALHRENGIRCATFLFTPMSSFGVVIWTTVPLEIKTTPNFNLTCKHFFLSCEM